MFVVSLFNLEGRALTIGDSFLVEGTGSVSYLAFQV